MNHAANGLNQEAKNYFELLELILENNILAIQVCDKVGQFVYMNKLARVRLGFTKIDYRNNTVFDIESYFKTTEQWDEELVFLKNAGIRIVEGQHTNIETKI